MHTHRLGAPTKLRGAPTDDPLWTRARAPRARALHRCRPSAAAALSTPAPKRSEAPTHSTPCARAEPAPPARWAPPNTSRCAAGSAARCRPTSREAKLPARPASERREPPIGEPLSACSERVHRHGSVGVARARGEIPARGARRARSRSRLLSWLLPLPSAQPRRKSFLCARDEVKHHAGTHGSAWAMAWCRAFFELRARSARGTCLPAPPSSACHGRAAAGRCRFELEKGTT